MEVGKRCPHAMTFELQELDLPFQVLPDLTQLLPGHYVETRSMPELTAHPSRSYFQRLTITRLTKNFCFSLWLRTGKESHLP